MSLYYYLLIGKALKTIKTNLKKDKEYLNITKNTIYYTFDQETVNTLKIESMVAIEGGINLHQSPYFIIVGDKVVLVTAQRVFNGAKEICLGQKEDIILEYTSRF